MIAFPSDILGAADPALKAAGELFLQLLGEGDTEDTGRRLDLSPLRGPVAVAGNSN